MSDRALHHAIRPALVAAVSAAAMLASLGLATGANGAPTAAKHANKPQVASLTGPSSLPSRIVSLAGSPGWLLYSQLPQRALGTTASSTYPTYDYARQNVVARDSQGRTHPLADSQGVQHRVTIAGSTVIAGKQQGVVDWWNLDSRKHGHIDVPSGEGYLTAAPEGVVVSTPTGEVKMIGIDGNAQSLGTPFPGNTSTISGISDGTGIVLSSQSPAQFAYQTWANPGHFTTLHVDSSYPTLSYPSCDAMTATYVACTVDEGTGQTRTVFDAPRLLRLNGGLQAAGSEDTTGGPVSVSGDTLLYTTPSGPPNYTLRRASVPAGGSTVSYSDPGVASFRTTAFGKAVFGSDDQTTISGATSATDVSMLVPVVLSPAEAVGFTLLPNRIVWIDDARRDSHAGDIDTIRDRSVSTQHGKLRLGRVHGVGRIPNGVVAVYGNETASRPIYAAGPTLAYLSAVDSNTDEIVVKSAHGHYRLPGTVYGANHRWVIYHTGKGAHGKIKVLNLGGGHSRRVLSHVPIGDAALSGNTAIVVARDGVRTVNLKTHHKSYLTHSSADVSGVRIAGSWVAWSAGNNVQLRNLRHPHSAKKLAGFHLAALTGRGALLSSVPQSPYGAASATSTWWRPFSGHAKRVLTARRFALWGTPQVQGNVLAWMTPSGQVLTRRLG